MSPLLFRKRIRIGPWYYANMSRSGVSHTVRLWPLPVSWNSRGRRIRVDLPGPFAWTSKQQHGIGGVFGRFALGLVVGSGLGAGVLWLLGPPFLNWLQGVVS